MLLKNLPKGGDNLETWIINKQNKIEFDREWERILVAATEKVAELRGLKANSEVSIFLTDNDYIQELNHLYRGKNYSTDVLSFAMQEKGEGEPDFSFPEDENILGDIVISMEKAEEQCRAYGHSFERELVYLAIHGLLHLLGYGHEEEQEKTQMRELEERVLEALHLGR